MTEETKRCVEALRWSHYHDDCTDENDTCPVKDECFRCDSVLCNVRIAADLIESLSAQLEQVTKDRDAAVEDIKEAAKTGCLCYVCESNNQGHCSAFDRGIFEGAVMCGQYKWRGVEVE